MLSSGHSWWNVEDTTLYFWIPQPLTDLQLEHAEAILNWIEKWTVRWQIANRGFATCCPTVNRRVVHQQCCLLVIGVHSLEDDFQVVQEMLRLRNPAFVNVVSCSSKYTTPAAAATAMMRFKFLPLSKRS